MRLPATSIRNILLFVALGTTPVFLGCTTDPTSRAEAQTADGAGLRAFQSEEELRDYLGRVRSQARQQAEVYDMAASDNVAAPPPPSTAPGESDGITNNQTAGVDEGGIVKARGDLLIVLRRGRVFTISTAGGEMRAIDSIDAFPPDADGRGSWYDEMLISGDRVIVIGYSYARGGTEVTRFRLTDEGRLTFEDAHQLRSNDYYSADNYASRLVGTELIFYTPLGLGYGSDPLDALPGVKRWNGDTGRTFESIAGPNQIYIAGDLFDEEDSNATALHSVTRCDLASDDFDCTATGVLAGWSREFYVSRDAVYLWVSDGESFSTQDPQAAHIYRLPLDGSRPSAIGARGMPIDQFSFLEQTDESRLNILVSASFAEPAIEIPRGTSGIVSLIQVPLADFGDGRSEIADEHYRQLSMAGNLYEMENRFVGNHIVYGWGRLRGYGPATGPRAFAASLDGGEATEIGVGHGVERIEQLGADAVVIGSGAGDKLGFSAVALTDGEPHVADTFTMPAAGQGESRSHAYFYRPDPGSADGASGTLGLPISRQVEPRFRQLLGSSAAMLFLRRDDRRFSRAGELDAHVEGVIDDNCQASCVDWYGNARPIFLHGRIFALMGYELVEGRLGNGRISEVERLDYAPRGERNRTPE
jgi:hypothetical protein